MDERRAGELEHRAVPALLLYFGIALATRDAVNASPVPSHRGSFVLRWQPGDRNGVLAGTYWGTVRLISSGNGTVWGQDFYVRATAPYTVGAAVPILLILLGVCEAFGIATSGKRATSGSVGQGSRAPAEGPPPSSAPCSPSKAPETGASSPEGPSEGEGGEKA